MPAKSITANFAQDLNDTDGDGLSNYAELVTHGTRANDNDTDNDGLLDNEEIQIGTDPNISNADLVEFFNSRGTADLDGQKGMKILADGGTVHWIDTPFFKTDDVSGQPLIGEDGRPQMRSVTKKLFKGEQTHEFPVSEEIYFKAEPDKDHTFAYWKVDGEADLNDYPKLIGNHLESFSVDSNVKSLEAVFVPIPTTSSRYQESNSTGMKIIANGGTVHWSSSPFYIYDVNTAMPTIGEDGRPLLGWNSKAIFSGKQIFDFPESDELFFQAEANENYTFSHWVIDGQVSYQKDEVQGNNLIVPFSIDSNVTTFEAVFLPENDEAQSILSNPSAYNLVTQSAYDEMMNELMSASDAETTPYSEGWFYLPNQGWLWTTRTTYPYFFDSTSKAWMYFQSGNEKPKFYHFGTKEWMTVE